MTQDRLKVIAERMKGQATAKAKTRAEAVFGLEPPGTQAMGRKAFLEYARRNWADPSFRTGLLTRVGPAQFRAVVLALSGGDEAAWPMPGSTLAKQQAMKPLPPMSDYQAQSLQDAQTKLLLEAQGGMHAGA